MTNLISTQEMDNIINSVISKSKDMEDVFIEDKKGNKNIDIFKLSMRLEKILQCVVYNNILYFKINGKYTSNEFELYRTIRNLNTNLKKTRDKEIYHQLNKTSNVVNEQYIKVNLSNDYCLHNGTVKLATGDFSPYTLNVEYNPTAYNENVDNFLN